MRTPHRALNHVPFAELRALLTSIFERHGVSPEVAAIELERLRRLAEPAAD